MGDAKINTGKENSHMLIDIARKVLPIRRSSS